MDEISEGMIIKIIQIGGIPHNRLPTTDNTFIKSVLETYYNTIGVGIGEQYFELSIFSDLFLRYFTYKLKIPSI